MPRTSPMVRGHNDTDWRERKKVQRVQSELKQQAERLSLSKSIEPADFDDARPRAVEFLRTLIENGNVARYVMKCGTSDGRQWLVAKRYSQFDTLKQKLRTLSPVVKVSRVPSVGPLWPLRAPRPGPGLDRVPLKRRPSVWSTGATVPGEAVGHGLLPGDHRAAQAGARVVDKRAAHQRRLRGPHHRRPGDRARAHGQFSSHAHIYAPIPALD